MQKYLNEHGYILPMETTNLDLLEARLAALWRDPTIPVDPKLAAIQVQITQLRCKLKEEKVALEISAAEVQAFESH